MTYIIQLCLIISYQRVSNLMAKPIVEKNYVSVRLDLPSNLNDWVNAESQKISRSKRNFLMLLIEREYKKSLSGNTHKGEGQK
ncbi:hypothetical protein M0H99_RS20235 [Proteus mirabilis]|nr:hypothetical protein [Escherichia coli]EJD6441795.1 hypothetical protein [Proteus mirabilis]ELB1288543.1 hypothetical protein [Morganella morganii]EJD6529976.1 hypothetical protein [Proteus mirabilis]EKT8676417.1 hypothetical protein [Proteus mirabilis]